MMAATAGKIQCKCGLAMIHDAAGFAHCSHRDRDCDAYRTKRECRACARLEKA